jgi:transcriptional regulator with XRE-family HTH domain
LAANVRRLRCARGFGTVTALADAAGVSKSQLYEILAGRSDASVDCVALLAGALGVWPCTLLQTTNTPSTSSGQAPRPTAAHASDGVFRNPAHGRGRGDPW